MKQYFDKLPFIISITVVVIVARLMDFYLPLLTHDLLIVSDVCIVALLLSFLPQKISRRVEFLLISCSLVLNMTESFLNLHFNFGFMPQIVTFISETNTDEIGGFLTSYVLSAKTGIVACSYIIAGTLVYLLYKNSNIFLALKSYSRSLTIAIILAAGVVQVGGMKLHRQYWLTFSDDNQNQERAYNGAYTPSRRILYSLVNSRNAGREIYLVKQQTQRAVITSVSYRSPLIIFYIGESYARGHSTLYGYKLNTTPYTCAEKQRGNLVALTNVVSYANYTSLSMKHIFSLHDNAQPGDWCDAPLFPALFRKAGYDVSFISSQFVNTDNDFVASFLSNKILSNMMFSYRNTSTCDYDEHLLAYLDTVLMQKHKADLVIINGNGQHFDYQDKYPPSFARFSAKDYVAHSELTESERSVMAAYDNATAYNDYVMEQIFRRLRKRNAIVIFISDHGECVYDDGDIRHGHATEGFTSPAICKEYEVPAWFWCTDSYRATHPDIYNSICSAANRPFMTDDIAQTLLSIAGIQSPRYVENNDLLSPSFTPKRRMMKGVYDYDTTHLH